MSVQALATTAIVSIAAGSVGYAKGSFDVSEQHSKYLAIESSWRLLWDKYVVFSRQLLIGCLRSSGIEYNTAYFNRLLLNVTDIGLLLSTGFSKECVDKFIVELEAYSRALYDMYKQVAATKETASDKIVSALYEQVVKVADSIGRVDCTLFSAEEAKALFNELTLLILQMTEQERVIDYKAGMHVYSQLQLFSADLANYYARAASIKQFPIRRWL